MAKKSVSHDNKKLRYLQSEIDTAKKERNKSGIIAGAILIAFIGVLMVLNGLWNSGILAVNDIVFMIIMFVFGMVFCGIDLKYWKDFNKYRDHIANCQDKIDRIQA